MYIWSFREILNAVHRNFHYKPTILGIPHLWKPSYSMTLLDSPQIDPSTSGSLPIMILFPSLFRTLVEHLADQHRDH